MPANVKKGADLGILVAHDDEGFLEELDRKEVARVCELAAVPDAVPVRQQQASQFTLEERGVAIEWLGQSVTGAMRLDRAGNVIDRRCLLFHFAFFVATHGRLEVAWNGPLLTIPSNIPIAPRAWRPELRPADIMNGEVSKGIS
jgi:hypothetical protein